MNSEDRQLLDFLLLIYNTNPVMLKTMRRKLESHPDRSESLINHFEKVLLQSEAKMLQRRLNQVRAELEENRDMEMNGKKRPASRYGVCT